MFCEKEIALDLRNFQRTCKERRQNLLETYLNEERGLNEEYSKNHKELLKSHKKQLRVLHSQIEEGKRKLKKKLEYELRLEKKNLKRLYQNKSHSVTHLNVLSDERSSIISLNDLQSEHNDELPGNISTQLPQYPLYYHHQHHHL
ncbi:unnamed protein product [Heterobilharzia americana]|nr:unnamed protein product [Heterobilharzia americana]